MILKPQRMPFSAFSANRSRAAKSIVCSPISSTELVTRDEYLLWEPYSRVLWCISFVYKKDRNQFAVRSFSLRQGTWTIRRSLLQIFLPLFLHFQRTMYAKRALIFGFLCAAVFLSAEAACGNSCKFRLCRPDGSLHNLRPKGGRILLRAPNTSLSPFICRTFPGGRTLGRIRSTGEAIISNVRISKWRPNGLSKKFSRKYFKLVNILYLGGKQGIGRIQSSGNQEDFLDEKCGILPIISYDIVENGKIFRTVSTTDAKDCVSFTTRTTQIVVECTWSSEDDFDLSVKGPKGAKTSANNDNLVGQCNSNPLVPAGKETVRFDPAKNGKYSFVLRHFKSCKGEKTNWTCRVVIDGVTKIIRKGLSSAGGNKIVGEEEFTYP